MLASARANLEFTKVRAPIDGVIGVSQVSIGSLVGQGEPTLLVTVSQLDPVRVRFPISEQLYLKNASRIQALTTTGEPTQRNVRLVLADGSEYPESGWISLVDRAVSVSTGTILVEARFPNPTGVLRPGQFGRVRGGGQKLPGALAVPQRAVLERQSLYELYVLGEGNKVIRRAVTVGPRIGRYWVIEKGLSAGEKVLIEGLQKVRADSVVVPKVVPLGDVNAKPATTGGAN
jgi:membrane fusion protein (multidrug efflux system)